MNLSIFSVSPDKESIAVYFIWYRLLTLAYVSVLFFTGYREINGLLLTLAIAYSVLLFLFRSEVFKILKARPYIILLDVFICYYLIYDTGAYETPYYLYSYIPIFQGAFLFGYTGALLLATIESILFVVVIIAGGYEINFLQETNEHIVTYFFFYFLAGTSVAYLANILNEFKTVTERKAVIDSELSRTKRCLELSLLTKDLSVRETQVLILSAEGKTVDQIASELGIAKGTISTYLRRIYAKLNVSSKQEALSQVIKQSEDFK